ncbi:MAG: DUF2083 domain-containing protein, partial [Silicimonas sp.]|nr:DUF2083 domain-containing protein [Silicimonas sp.]
SRIRAVRLDQGVRQAEIARRCDISSSYLNLIEHNRRRIGGALLNRLANALGVDPASLSEGVGSTLTAALESAAARHPDTPVDAGRAEELAGRFPGWARLIQRQHREIQRLERAIEGLTDRLTHDPFLSASLHDVLSSVTAIRSASSILADGGEIAPEWQARFHRNIFEDSRRLAQSTEALVSYLDAGADIERGISLPQEDVEIWLEGQGWRVAALEEAPETDIGDLLAADTAPQGAAARHLAERYLAQYAADVRAVPLAVLAGALAEGIDDPGALASRFGTALPVIFRRLATLPAEAFPDAQPRGLLACDGSGTLIFRKPVPGFDVPRFGAACPLWPLFQALQRPMQPLRQSLHAAAREPQGFTAWAVSEARFPGGFAGPAVIEAWMLIQPEPRGARPADTLNVGASCRICAHADCPARREPPLVATVDAG